MPFTPFHIGPHASVGLPFYRYLDIPVFIGVNIAIDIEPLLVMLFNLSYPLHGYCHTLMIGSLVGFGFATIAHPFRQFMKKGMSAIRLPYSPSYLKMVCSGVLGAWLHIFFDAFLYLDIRPFYPFKENPLYGRLAEGQVYIICSICFIPALLFYGYLLFFSKKTEVDGPA